MKKKFKFSIITPVLNNQKYIKNNLASLKKQTYKNFEHIVIDGGSKDNTIDIIKKNKSHNTLVVSKKDKNLWEAINKGIKLSKGDIICVLNSDDYFYKDALKIINSYFVNNNKLDYIFGAVNKYNRILYKLEKEKIFYKFNVYPSHSVSFFVKKSVHKKIGVYDENLDFCSDYDFFYRLFNSKKIKETNTKRNEIVGFFRPGGISENVSLLKKIFLEFKIRFKNGQNLIFLILLLSLTLINIFRNYIINNPFKK